MAREEQIELLTQALEQAAQGIRPTVICFRGASGHGKSRLLDEARRLALDRGYTCVGGQTVLSAIAELGASAPDNAGAEARPLHCRV